jgi:hypothetical protein
MAQEDEKEVDEKEVKDQEKKEAGSPTESKGEEKEERNEEKVEEEQQQQIELPPANFENFIFGLYNTALIHLGVRDPETGRLIQNLPFARHTIDTLGMIQEKTRGNLTAPEGNLLENLLYELRMNYLRAAKQPEDESKEEPETEENHGDTETQRKEEEQGKEHEG